MYVLAIAYARRCNVSMCCMHEHEHLYSRHGFVGNCRARLPMGKMLYIRNLRQDKFENSTYIDKTLIVAASDKPGSLRWEFWSR